MRDCEVLHSPRRSRDNRCSLSIVFSNCGTAYHSDLMLRRDDASFGQGYCTNGGFASLKEFEERLHDLGIWKRSRVTAKS